MVLGGALRVVGCVHGVRWCLSRGWVCGVRLCFARGWICGGSVYEIIIYNRYVAYQTNLVYK